MIYIRETYTDEQYVFINVDGVLDSESLDLLSDVCEHHINEGEKILLNLEGISHISREGRHFLKEIEIRGIIVNFPKFLILKESTGDFKK